MLHGVETVILKQDAVDKNVWKGNENMKIRQMETITDSSGCGYENLNWSDIQTKLIQLAGAHCERYASDLLIDLRVIESWLKNDDKQGEKKFLFGFREYGVDHRAFVESRGYDSPEYKEIWKLTANKDFGKIKLVLEKIS